MSNTKLSSTSLGVRLIAIIVVVVTLILTAIGALQYNKTRTIYTKLVDEGLNAACVRLSGNLGNPLWSFNKEQTVEVLNSEMAQEALVAITVHMGTDVKPFAGAQRDSSGRVEPLAEEAELPPKLLKRTFAVPWEGNSIASGTIYYSLNSLKQTLHAQVVSTIVQTVVTDLVLIVLIGLVLSSIVVRPLGSLTAVAKNLAIGDLSGHVVGEAIVSLREIAKKLHRDELGALTSTFNHMLENLQARDLELDGHRKNLERLVADRTIALTKRNEEMRLVLDNVDQGLVLVSPTGTMSEERSAAFSRFFGDSETDAATAIFEEPKARAFFRLGYEQVAEAFMPIDVILQQLPTSARNGAFTFGLRYQPLMTGDECAGVLFMINDITGVLAAQKRDREQYEQIRVFERCMRDRIGFVEFFHEARKMVEQVRDERFGSPEERLRVIHTLKGNSSLFDVLSVADVAHVLESALLDGEHDAAVTHQTILLSAWDAFAQRVALLIGEDLSDRFELSRFELDDIIDGLKRGQPSTEIVRQLVAITYEPMKLRFSRIEQQLCSLAERLQKAPVECSIQVGSLRLPPDLFAPFWSAFAHVVRNVADHGLERSEERAGRGKPANNQVSLLAVADARSIEIEIADDGHGVDWVRVASKAKNQGLPHTTRRDLVNALFSPGFSTAEQVSAISGRGVGLSAVAIEVLKLRGTYSVESEAGKGTRFRFSFPSLETFDARTSVIPRISVAPVSTQIKS